MTASTVPATPADEVARIVQDLYDIVVSRRMAHPVLDGMFNYIFLRLGRMRLHLAGFLARISAGKPPRVRAPRSEAAAAQSRRRLRNPVQWPRKFGALAEMLCRDGALFAERLSALLADDEMVAFIAANPGIGRTLRPLCRTLGVKLIPELRLKRRPRAKVARKTSAPTAGPAPCPVPHPPIPAASMMTFTPTEDDPPMAERVARYLARRRSWHEL